MSINDIADTLEAAARSALARSGAIRVCRLHSDVTIRRGDPEAERRAYAIATNMLKSDGTLWLREDLMPEIKRQLDEAADEECPQCAHLRDE